MTNRVRERRKLAGLTQLSLARQALIAPSDLSQVEQGKKPLFPKWAVRIATVLNCKPDDLGGT